MDAAEVEESLFATCDAKLHGGMCKTLSTIVCKILEIFPVLEAGRPRSKSGIQSLCSLHLALDKAKNLLQHCSECSKLYLAITGDSVLMKFEKARSALQESLRRVEDIVPQAVACQILEIVAELERSEFALDPSEKKVGEDVIALIQKERKFNGNSNDGIELEVFHQAASKLGIKSSRAALTERRALKKLIERARAEDDKRKESIVAYLLHLMRKYSKVFRSDVADDTDSQGSAPCSPMDSSEANGRAFERHLSKLSSFNFRQNGRKPGNMSTPPEEFRCPISLQLMYDPVIISSGQTYERVCIEKWFKDGHSTCPKTQQQLSHLGLIPNYCVKGLIASWCEQNGLPIPDGPPESLDLNYWRLALSEREATNSSVGSVTSCQKGIKVVPLEESGTIEELKEEVSAVDNGSCQDAELDASERYESLLSALHNGQNRRKQFKAVEEIRLLLKDDEEARIYMGANGFVEALVEFLTSAVDEGDERGEEMGAMALFNLAVNNNRNKASVLSSGVMPLLEDMITNSDACESAAALYLNLSCLDDAKPIIGSSGAVPYLVRFLYPSSPHSASCRHDALHCLYNLSTHPPSIPSLLAGGILGGLHSLLTGLPGCTWADKALAVLMNLVSNSDAREKTRSTAGLITSVAAVLDSGEPSEQEKAVTCLLVLCNGDDKCSHMVLQEGVVPALVSLSANGTARGKEQAKKLLKLFREQRQREISPELPQRQQQHQQQQQQQQQQREERKAAAMEPKPLCKSRSTMSGRFGKRLTSFWKSKNFSVNEC